MDIISCTTKLIVLNFVYHCFHLQITFSLSPPAEFQEWQRARFLKVNFYNMQRSFGFFSDEFVSKTVFFSWFFYAQNRHVDYSGYALALSSAQVTVEFFCQFVVRIYFPTSIFLNGLKNSYTETCIVCHIRFWRTSSMCWHCRRTFLDYQNSFSCRK